MDVGRFVRRRTELWAWILGPIVLIWLTHAGVLLYHLIAESTLAGLKAHREVVPRMLETRDTVHARLAEFQRVLNSEAGTMAGITAVLDHAEEVSGFAVISWQRETATLPKEKNITAVQVSVIGAGRLDEVSGFLKEVQQPLHLIDVLKADLSTLHGSIYNAHLVFRCYTVTDAEAKASAPSDKAGVHRAG